MRIIPTAFLALSMSACTGTTDKPDTGSTAPPDGNDADTDTDTDTDTPPTGGSNPTDGSGT